MRHAVLCGAGIWIALFLLPGCTTGTPEEKAEVLGAVEHYNGMLRRAYLEANIFLLQAVATEQQIAKVFPAILALQAKEQSMRTEQTLFRVNKVSLEDDKAWVDTEETWVYWFQNARTGEIVEPEKTLTYHIRYHLIRRDAAWLVDRLEDMD